MILRCPLNDRKDFKKIKYKNEYNQTKAVTLSNKDVEKALK